MGNTLNTTVEYLRDPLLVRKFQELCGVQQILLTDGPLPAAPESETDTEIEDTSKDEANKKKATREDSSFKRGHSRESSNEFQTSDKSTNKNSVSSKNFHNGSSTATSLEWIKRKTKVRKRIKSSSSPPSSPGHSRTSSLDSDIGTPVNSTEPVPVEVTVESYPLLDVYFHLATECGYEPFYITFIPFLFWNVDSYISRHGVILWCLSMYVGQACKQIFKWKRPASPPAFRLEQNPNLETEYGFPSTHAVVSTVLPFYFLYSTYGRYEVRYAPNAIFCSQHVITLLQIIICQSSRLLFHLNLHGSTMTQQYLQVYTKSFTYTHTILCLSRHTTCR